MANTEVSYTRDDFLAMLDPQLRPIVSQIPPTDYSSPEAKRNGAPVRPVLTPYVPDDNFPGVRWSDRAVNRSDGGGVPVRIYDAPGTDWESDGIRDCYVHLHGGGYVSGNETNTHRRSQIYATVAGCTVISVGYRLSPEDPYPAALEDGAAVIKWVRELQLSTGAPQAAIGVGGDSAGGGIAAALALLMRDNAGPDLRFQLLLYPTVDDRRTTGSVIQFWNTPVLRGSDLAAMWGYYFAGLNGAEPPYYAAAGRAQDLSGLPMTYLLACEGDPLRDEGLEYGERLLQAGISTEIRCAANSCHAFDTLVPDSTLAQSALYEQAAYIKKAFTR